jgi:diguanylate cyclase (GGDEF)-like protein
MEAGALSRQVRRRVLAIIQDAPPADGLLPQLRELRRAEGVAACSIGLALLTHVSLPESEAEHLLEALARHRDELTRKLKRDPGLQVAAVDYLSNVARLITQPAIVERAELERTERSAVTDDVTGLYNRRYFMSALALELRRSRRYELPLALLMLDLDSFKALNDLHGHPFGDRVLERVGRLLRRSVREADVPCRFGGEEFAVILPETERLGAYTVAERVRRQLADDCRLRPIEGRLVEIQLSGGIAVYPIDAGDASALVARADQALYQAKSLGRNRISVFHPERRGAMRWPARSELRADLLVRGSGLRRGRAVDVSASGMLVEVDGDGFEGQEPVELRLALGGAAHGDDVVTGRVVRVEASPTEGQTVRLAVRFDRALPDAWVERHTRRAPRPRRA